jgi:hypothetical protein
VELTLNGKVACLSIANYSATGDGGHSHGGGGMGDMGGMGKEQGMLGETLASISKCTEPIAIKKGDKLKVKSNFDLNKHPT